MRIVSGRFRGRPLAAPAGPTTRPTSDRLRQAVFNMLEHAAWSPGLDDLRVIDLFAGSGAMGLEALSRGAAYALFVETDAAARRVLRDNIAALAPDGALKAVTRTHPCDARTLGRRPADIGAAFDLAFLDPPYGEGLCEPALQGLAAGGWLRPGTLAVVERAAAEPRPQAEPYALLDARTHGAAQVFVLRFGG